MLFKGERTFVVRDMGGFIAHVNMPGWLRTIPTDHGHGPLAMVVESILHPGRLIAMHEHRNDEIISWVPQGIMRHEDRSAGRLIVDRDHLLVMNSGRGFWHSEQTFPSDPPLRMLQILLRPNTADLAPGIQYGAIPEPASNAWRHLVGPQGGIAPFHVRNVVDFFDIGLECGVRVDFPRMPGRDLYFYVFDGAVVVEGQQFCRGEQGLFLSDHRLAAEATEPSLMVAFLLDPRSPIVKAGTVGDSGKIPPAIAIVPLKMWKRFKRRCVAIRRSISPL